MVTLVSKADSLSHSSFQCTPPAFLYLRICLPTTFPPGFPGDSVIKNQPAGAREPEDTGLIPGSGRSSGVRNGNPLQYSWDRGI